MRGTRRGCHAVPADAARDEAAPSPVDLQSPVGWRGEAGGCPTSGTQEEALKAELLIKTMASVN